MEICSIHTKAKGRDCFPAQSVRDVTGLNPSLMPPTPLPLSSQPNEKKPITFKISHLTYRNKGLTHCAFWSLFENKGLTVRTG